MFEGGVLLRAPGYHHRLALLGRDKAQPTTPSAAACAPVSTTERSRHRIHRGGRSVGFSRNLPPSLPPKLAAGKIRIVFPRILGGRGKKKTKKRAAGDPPRKIGFCALLFFCQNPKKQLLLLHHLKPNQALSPPGSYANRGLLSPCPAGRYGEGWGGAGGRGCTRGSFTPYYYPLRPQTSPAFRAYIVGAHRVFLPTQSGGEKALHQAGPKPRTFVGETRARPISDRRWPELPRKNMVSVFVAPSPNDLPPQRAMTYCRYGATYGLSSRLCSGSCDPGFYCPPGSVSPRERACGGASLICPGGSGWPVAVDEGWAEEER